MGIISFEIKNLFFSFSSIYVPPPPCVCVYGTWVCDVYECVCAYGVCTCALACGGQRGVSSVLLSCITHPLTPLRQVSLKLKLVVFGLAG